MSSQPWVDELQVRLNYAIEERDAYKAKLDRIEKYINSYDSGKGSAWDLECGLVEILREEG